jgi:glycosyl transferase family 4
VTCRNIIPMGITERDEMNARICLIAPSHLSTNPRLVKEADALTEAGYDVAVITADFSQWGRCADAEFRERRWQVIASPCFGPLAPIRTRIPELVRRTTARFLVGKCNLYHPFLVRAACHPIAPKLLSWARHVRADLYIGHYTAALPAAAIAAHLHGTKYAFDAEDFHLGDSPDGPAHELERQLTRAIESRYLPGCVHVTAASPGIAEAYERVYGIKRPTVVLNVFPRARAPEEATPKGSAKPSPSVYWYSQTIGSGRGIECAIRAISRARSRPHLYLRGKPAPGFADRLLKLAAEVEVSDRLHILPLAPPSEMERLAALYDVGLVGETGDTQNRKIALTNKLFSYLLAGVPAVMSDIPAHRAFAEQFGSAAARVYRVDDPDGLATALDALLCDKDALATARASAFALGQTRLNWDVEKSVLLERVAESLHQCAGMSLRTGDSGQCRLSHA